MPQMRGGVRFCSLRNPKEARFVAQIGFHLSEHPKLPGWRELLPPESRIWSDRAIFRRGLASLVAFRGHSSGGPGVGFFEVCILRLDLFGVFPRALFVALSRFPPWRCGLRSLGLSRVSAFVQCDI